MEGAPVETLLPLLLLLLLGTRGSEAVVHSMKYFYTGSTGVPNFPEFVAVGVLDGVQVSYYDSNTKRFLPKQAWMDKVRTDDPEYWDWNTLRIFRHQLDFKVKIENLRQRFNRTEGVHMYQLMYGCDWDDETGEVDGFDQYAFDGEDFIAFDLKTRTWVAAKPQAVMTKHIWDNNNARNILYHHYLSKECPEWLKKYMDYGRSYLLRTKLPSMFLLQKTRSSPLTCFVTGFYPDRAVMFWRRDGAELQEDVDVGESLPNHDGTFQMSAELEPRPPDADWHRYECVFQLSGVKEDVVTRLDSAAVRSNTDGASTIFISVAVAAALLLLLLAVAFAIGFFFDRKKKAEKKKASTSTGTLTQPAGSASASRSSAEAADTDGPLLEGETPRQSGEEAELCSPTPETKFLPRDGDDSSDLRRTETSL